MSADKFVMLYSRSMARHETDSTRPAWVVWDGIECPRCKYVFQPTMRQVITCPSCEYREPEDGE